MFSILPSACATFAVSSSSCSDILHLQHNCDHLNNNLGHDNGNAGVARYALKPFSASCLAAWGANSLIRTNWRKKWLRAISMHMSMTHIAPLGDDPARPPLVNLPLLNIGIKANKLPGLRCVGEAKVEVQLAPHQHPAQQNAAPAGRSLLPARLHSVGVNIPVPRCENAALVLAGDFVKDPWPPCGPYPDFRFSLRVTSKEVLGCRAMLDWGWRFPIRHHTTHVWSLGLASGDPLTFLIDKWKNP
eukprot:jgi/Mesvir1/24743/Mv22005-RA.1